MLKNKLYQLLYKDKDRNYAIIIAILFLYIIVLTPLINTKFAVGDDLDDFIKLKTWEAQSFIGWKQMSLPQGRFFGSIVMHLYAVPYIYNSYLWYNFTYIFPFVVLFVLFTIFIHKLFNNKSFTISVAFLLPIFFQVIGWGSITTCYPFVFTFGLIIAFVSLILLLKYYDNKKYSFIIISSILMSLTYLFYEIFLLFNIIVIAIVLYKNSINMKSSKQQLLKAFKEYLPFLIIGCLYFIIYFCFRLLYPRSETMYDYYQGTSINNNMNIWKVIKGSFLMSSFSIPLYYFRVSLFRDLTMNIDGCYDLLKQDVSTYILFIIAFCLTFITLKSYKKIKTKKLMTIMLICFFMFFFFSIMLCMTSVYSDNKAPHVPTFFTYFPVIVFIICFFFVLLNITQKHKIINYCTILFLSLSVSYIGYCVQFSNKYVIKDIHLGRYRFDMVDECFRKNIVNINPSTPICMEQLNKTTSMQTINVTKQKYITWRRYIYRTSNKKINEYKTYKELYKIKSQNIPIVYTSFVQAKKSVDAIMCFAFLNSQNLPIKQQDIVSDSVVCLYYSPYKEYNITMATQQSNDVVYLDGKTMQNIGSYHSANVKFKPKRNNKVSHFTIVGKNIVVSSIKISNIF